MDRPLLIGFITSHSISLLMSISLLYVDITRPRFEAKVYFERVLPVVFGFGQVAIITAAIIYAVAALTSRLQVYWLEPLFLCALQADVAINVARNLRYSDSPNWIVLYVYGACLVTVTLEFTLCIRSETSQLTYNSFLYLAGLAAIASTVSIQRLYAHKQAGGGNLRYIRLLLAFIISNAAVALCQLINAVIIYVQLVSNRMISDRLYQSMLLACTSTQLLCPLVFCLGRVASLRRESIRAANSDNHVDGESSTSLNFR